MSNFKRLERICTISENKEQIQLKHWLAAKKEVDDAHTRLTQLNQFFQGYITENDPLTAQFFQNKQIMLDLVREAITHQKQEIERLKRSESEQYSLYQAYVKERKVIETLAANRQKKWINDENKKIANQQIETMLQMHLRKK